MTFIDELELQLDILSSEIPFESLVNEILNDNYEQEELEEKLNGLGGVRGVFENINNRFVNLFNLDIFYPINGYSVLHILENDNTKKYLHKFLINKSEVGGSNAISDGSDLLFEEISANSVSNFLGNNSKIIMMGQDNARLTEHRLEEVTAELNESKGSLLNLPAQAKDDGVDFIVYKSIDARNEGNIIVLGQACVGKHYSGKKSINKRWTNEYINFSIHPPITLLSIVHYLDSSALKKVQSNFENAIVFDRARILQYFDDSDEVLNNKIIDFVENL